MPQPKQTDLTLCTVDDLIPGSGVCALVGDTQIAIFYLPEETPQVYAIGNYDPIGKANVLSRGIVGDIDGKLVVASPLYKQHFVLADGHCIEDADINVPVFQLSVKNDQVVLISE